MTLADELLSFLKTNSGNPDFVKLDKQIEALCVVMERHLANKIDRLPPRHADGTLPQITAKPRRKQRRDD